MLFKNVANQKIHVYAYDSTTGAAKTGDAANITAYVSLDGTANAIDDTNPAEVDATNMPGVYCFDLAQAETNCNAFALYAKSSTSNIRIEPIIGFTTGAETLNVNASHLGGTAQTGRDIGAALPNAAPGANGGLPTTNGTKINQTVDLTAGQIPTADAIGTDAASKVLATPAQKLVTDANGYVTYSNTAPPSAASIADAVWDEVVTTGAHDTATFAGAGLLAASSAGDPWSTALPGSYGDGTAGKIIGTNLATASELAKVPKSDGVLTFNTTCSSDIKSGLSTQAELNKVPKSDGSTSWNATALAAIQQEATDALNAYDPPTKTEQDTAFTEIKGATFNGATDSLEAIRDRGDSAWVTATGFGTSNFDPTSDKVYLGDGAHGGSSATITAKSVTVENSAGDALTLKSTSAGKHALKLESTGAGNSNGINISSTTGLAINATSGSHGISINSSAGNGLVVAGATGDIVADITGDLSGAAGSVTSAVTITSNADITAILQDTGTTLDGKINTIDTVVDLIEDIVRNKMEVVEATGAATLYADDSTTPLLTNTVSSAGGTTTRTRLA